MTVYLINIALILFWRFFCLEAISQCREILLRDCCTAVDSHIRPSKLEDRRGYGSVFQPL